MNEAPKRLLSKTHIGLAFLVVLFCALSYFSMSYIQNFYQDMKSKATYQIGLDIATSFSIIISAIIFAVSSFKANEKIEKQRVLEERTSRRIQKMYDINSKIGASIAKLIRTLQSGQDMEEAIPELVQEIFFEIDMSIFNLGVLGTDGQVDILIKARSGLEESITTNQMTGKTSINMSKLRQSLLDVQRAIMVDARKIITMEENTEKRVYDLLEKIYGPKTDLLRKP